MMIYDCRYVDMYTVKCLRYSIIIVYIYRKHKTLVEVGFDHSPNPFESSISWTSSNQPQADTNGDGMIEYDEFLNYFHRHEAHIDEARGETTAFAWRVFVEEIMRRPLMCQEKCRSSKLVCGDNDNNNNNNNNNHNHSHSLRYHSSLPGTLIWSLGSQFADYLAFPGDVWRGSHFCCWDLSAKGVECQISKRVGVFNSKVLNSLSFV